MSAREPKTPAWLIERLAQGELDGDEAAAVRARLTAEGRSPDDVIAALVLADRQTLAAHPPASVAAEVRRRAAPPTRRRSAIVRATFAGALATAGALVVVLATGHPPTVTPGSRLPVPEPTTIKGTAPTAGARLYVYRHAGAGDERLADGERAAPGISCNSPTRPRRRASACCSRSTAPGPSPSTGPSRAAPARRRCASAVRCGSPRPTSWTLRRPSNVSSWCAPMSPSTSRRLWRRPARCLHKRRWRAARPCPSPHVSTRFPWPWRRPDEAPRFARPSVAPLRCARGARATEPTGSVRLRRFALLVGVNDGGAARARLRYAASDAHAMARVLESLGGVAPGDLVFVADGSRRALQDGFAAVERMLRAEQSRGVRRELVFYYSGHSDEDGLLLGGERISYQELRAFIHEAPADLSLAILDSCESGAFTRHKGGARRTPFLLDASIDTHGHAFLTSSAANEVAQESDRIAASFFTYFLVSGLRGAADANRDRRVTLQEAFQFASQETLARTERTQGGPQHAAYEFDLTGTGDMVVTDVRTTQSGLVLTPELSGRISVREAGGALIAELRKPAGSSVELGLEAGAYVVAVESGGA